MMKRMKYIYLALGALLTIAVVAGIVLTTHYAFADEISVYLPIFGGDESVDNVEASGVVDADEIKIPPMPSVAPKDIPYTEENIPKAPPPHSKEFLDDLDRQLEEEDSRSSVPILRLPDII